MINIFFSEVLKEGFSWVEELFFPDHREHMGFFETMAWSMKYCLVYDDILLGPAKTAVHSGS